MKYIKFILATGAFVVILLAVYLTHVTFFRVNVVFYGSILDGFIATAVAILLVSFLGFFSDFSRFEKVLLACIWILIGYSFAISVPTVLDRSLSFYVLEKLQQRGGGIKLSAFEDVFTKEYVKEHRLVDVRLTEQEQSGTLVIKDGCVKLTDWGNTLATSSRYFRNHFLPKQRLLRGEYSSDLTDPFKSSDSNVSYFCK